MVEIRQSDDIFHAILRTRKKIKHHIPAMSEDTIQEINSYDFSELKKIGVEQVIYLEQETAPELFRRGTEGWILAYLYKPEIIVPLSCNKAFNFEIYFKNMYHSFTCNMEFTGDIYIKYIEPVLFTHKGYRSTTGNLRSANGCISRTGRFGDLVIPAYFTHTYTEDGEEKEKNIRIRPTDISSVYSTMSFHPHVSCSHSTTNNWVYQLTDIMYSYNTERVNVREMFFPNGGGMAYRQNMCTGNFFENTNMEGVLNISSFIFRLNKMYHKPSWSGAYTGLNHFHGIFHQAMIIAKKPWEEAYRRLVGAQDTQMADTIINYTITPEETSEELGEMFSENFGIKVSTTSETDWSVDFSQGNFSELSNPVEEIPGLEEYFSRFSGMQDIIKTITMGVCIIGLGNLGSRIASDVKNMGFEKFYLIDKDTVEKQNIYTQVYGNSDIGTGKAYALKEVLVDRSIYNYNEHRLHDDITPITDTFEYIPLEIEGVRDKRYFNNNTSNPFTSSKSIYNYNIFIVATDNMESRKQAWQWVREWGLPTWVDASVEPEVTINPIYIDVRMGRDFIQVWAFNPNSPIAVKGYEKILEVLPFSEEVCGETSHNYMGTTVSAVVQRVLLNYLKDVKYPYMTHITNDLQIHTRELPDEEPVPQRLLIYKHNVAEEEEDYTGANYYYHESETDQYKLFRYLKDRMGEEDTKKAYKSSDWFSIIDLVKVRKVNAFPSGESIIKSKYKGIRPVFQHNFGGGWSYSRRLHPLFKQALEKKEYCEHCSAKNMKPICDAKGCFILSDDNIKIRYHKPASVEGLDKIRNIHKTNKFFKV